MRFVLHELFDATGHCELLGNGLDRELIDGVLEEAARYTGGEIAPLNRNSDEEGVTLKMAKCARRRASSRPTSSTSTTAGRA